MRHWREMRETGRVLYPFGYGLTYGSAELAEVKVNGQAVARNGEVMPADKDGLTVEALVANTGSRDLREVGIHKGGFTGCSDKRKTVQFCVFNRKCR